MLSRLPAVRCCEPMNVGKQVRAFPEQAPQEILLNVETKGLLRGAFGTHTVHVQAEQRRH